MKIFLIPAALMLLTANTICQENSSEVFSEIIISGEYDKNISMGDLDEYWKAGPGISVSAETPFYSGIAGLGLDVLLFDPITGRQPDFKTFFIHLIWRQQLNLFWNTKLSAGFKVGSFIMKFNDETLTEFESNESELAVSALIKFEVPITGSVSAYINSSFTTVFTFKRLKLFNAGGGLSYSFDSPSWFRDFLK